jgi:acyl-CoA thioester hydrolase
MISNSIQFRIRYSETDQMSFAYHGNYVQYLEMGRIELLREIGIPYKEVEASGIILPVIDLNIKYLKSANYDDLITLETTLVKLPTVKIEFTYKLFNEKKELITTASTTLAFLKTESKRPTRVPKDFLDKILKITR